MSDSLIYVLSVITILEPPDKKEAVIEYIKRRGREIRESTFKTTKERLRHIRLNKCSKLLRYWR